MKLNDWVGDYQLVYKRNDPMEGLINIFQHRDGKCYEWRGNLQPSVEDLDLIAAREKAP